MEGSTSSVMVASSPVGVSKNRFLEFVAAHSTGFGILLVLVRAKPFSMMSSLVVRLDVRPWLVVLIFALGLVIRFSGGAFFPTWSKPTGVDRLLVIVFCVRPPVEL
jgi:hypothetical protein